MKRLADWIELRMRAQETPRQTGDEIMDTCRFTHPFREWDLTTRELRRIQPKHASYEDILFNYLWLRLTCKPEHPRRVGWIYGRKITTELRALLNSDACFTRSFICSAALPGYTRAESVVNCLENVAMQDAVLHDIVGEPTIQNAFKVLQCLPLVGKFTAYEIACDMRYVGPLELATDTRTWANVGPGSGRGLEMLDLVPCVTNMRKCLTYLYAKLPGKCLRPLAPPELHRFGYRTICLELREVEHSLCETMKYLRAKDGGFVKKWTPRSPGLTAEPL